MGGLGGLIDSLLRMAHVHLEPWMAPAVGLALALLLAPFWLRNQHTARARRVWSRARGAGSAAERARIEAEAIGLVEGNPDGLVSLADLAVADGRFEVARGLLARLRATGRRPVEVARLARTLEGDLPATALQVVIQVERLLEEGMTEPARALLDRALRRWPEHPELRALTERTDAVAR